MKSSPVHAIDSKLPVHDKEFVNLNNKLDLFAKDMELHISKAFSSFLMQALVLVRITLFYSSYTHHHMCQEYLGCQGRFPGKHIYLIGPSGTLAIGGHTYRLSARGVRFEPW